MHRVKEDFYRYRLHVQIELCVFDNNLGSAIEPSSLLVHGIVYGIASHASA